MATILKINRQFEEIKVVDHGEVIYSWEVATDDKSLDAMMKMAGNAMDRAQVLTAKEQKADTEEGRQEALDAIVRLQKRVIISIIGEDGYNDVLDYIGSPYGRANHAENIVNVGEVFAALCVWLYEHCTSKQLRQAGVVFTKEQAAINDNRAAFRAKAGKKKK